jgi:methionyl-tRNA formyltransferase
MIIQILCDNPNSWMIPYARKIQEKLRGPEHKVTLEHDHKAIKEGDILILLSCEKLFRKLNLNKHNLVVHGSLLPLGKGWSPLTWEILEGKNSIAVTLFEAADKVDSGVIYGQKIVELNGAELIDELREKQASATAELISEFVKAYPIVKGVEQSGEESFYRKRVPEDSRLDVSQSLQEQFNLLRVCDNERYPAFFEMFGEKYIIKIYKQGS